MINIYCDGSVKNGIGGYAYVIQFNEGMTITAKFKYNTKNINELEMLAVIEALRAINDTWRDITVYTDSNFVLDFTKNPKYLETGTRARELKNQLYIEIMKNRVTFLPAYKFLKIPLHIEAHNLAKEATSS